MDFSGKKITIIGTAKSGQSAARLLKRLQGLIKISEKAPEGSVSPDFLSWAKANAAATEFNGHTKEFIQDSDLVVLSPGVRIDAQPVFWAKEKGIPVWGEVELAYRLCDKPIIAVTGSNGKTTVVTLIAEILKRAGKTPCLCGNVGYPFADHVLDKKYDSFVLEVSSFQMETIEKFKPKVAVLLNFSQNHLDRHKDLQEYFDAKKRIFLNQDKNDFAVLNAQDERVSGLSSTLKARVSFFNTLEQIKHTQIKNPNFLAAMEVARVLGISEKVCLDVFKNFKGVEHRLEKVRILAGVEYINDSKATTVEAGRWAIERTEHPIILLCGGRDKNLDFKGLTALLKQKVKTVVVFGEAREKLRNTFGPVVKTVVCDGNLNTAVETARSLASSGDCVLLSPMCTSFDMFKNFEERGKVFKEIVQQLK